jgi:hypothetical protein
LKEKEVEEAEEWQDIADMIIDASLLSEDSDEEETEDESDDEDGEDFSPEIDEVYGYKPPRARKEHDCKVIKVNTRKGTVDLERLDDPDRVYKGVSFEKLVLDED